MADEAPAEEVAGEAPPVEEAPAEAPAAEEAPAQEATAEAAAPPADGDGGAAPPPAEGDAPADGGEPAAPGNEGESGPPAESEGGAAVADGAGEGEAATAQPQEAAAEGHAAVEGAEAVAPAADEAASGEAPAAEGGGEVAEGGENVPAAEAGEGVAEAGEASGSGGGDAAAAGEGGETVAASEGDAHAPAPAGGLTEEQQEAATKIQSMARGKEARNRVQRIKMGDEDPFAESGEKVRKARKSADGAPTDGGGEGEAVLDDSGVGELAGGEEGTLDDSMDDAEARQAAELKAREEKLRLEAEARQARITERLELGKKYAAAVAQKEALVAANADLQRKLAAHIAAKRSEESAPATAADESAEVSQGDMETRYFQSLRQVADNRAELEKVQLSYDQAALDMKTRLEQKQDKVRELKESFVEFKKGVALGTAAGATGRLIPVKLLKQLEEQAGEKETELEKVRLKNIHLRNQLRKLEGNLRRKEELSNELHLIDFEQLKIENQTLNEKIEERNEELLKLRKKTTTTVQVLTQLKETKQKLTETNFFGQVLTHLKEKLQFVQAENQLLKVELAELEAELSTHRDALTRAKHDRDALRAENLRLRGEAGLIGNNDLLRDFDRRKKDIASMQVTLEGLKGRHRTLREQVVDINAKTLQASY